MQEKVKSPNKIGDPLHSMAKVIVIAHLPVMIIEGLITLFCIKFLKRVKPIKKGGFHSRYPKKLKCALYLTTPWGTEPNTSSRVKKSIKLKKTLNPPPNR